MHAESEFSAVALAFVRRHFKGQSTEFSVCFDDSADQMLCELFVEHGILERRSVPALRSRVAPQERAFGLTGEGRRWLNRING